MSREVVLARRPEGVPTAEDFELREVDVGEPGDGEVLVRNVYVSVDPYMRSRMTGIRTYVGPYEVGGPIDGGAVGQVVTSRHAGFAEGDWVMSMLGWREGGVAKGDHLRKLDPALAPPSTAVGVLGMPGLTAWFGLVEVGRVVAVHLVQELVDREGRGQQAHLVELRAGPADLAGLLVALPERVG